MIGKSTGIALLMAAALLAALFSMGVFSATGVGAQEDSGPTATAELVDKNDPATADSTADDTLVITFSGLARQAGNTGNAITITMEEALGATAPTAADWSGGDQYEDSLTVGTYATGGYPVTITGPIEDGTAILEIATTDNTIDSNTMITALTVGRTDSLQTVTNVPIAITGAPQGPAITIDPESAGVDADATLGDSVAEVTVTGAHFDDDTPVTISAVDDADTPAGVDINGFEDADNDPATAVTAVGGTDVTVAAANITDGAFTATVYIPITSAGEITLTATQGADTSTAVFTVNPPAPPAEPGVALSSQTPSAAVQITITGHVAARIKPNQDIQVDLDPFTVPSTIADAAIDITSDGFNGSPTNVLVTGKKVTMTIPRPESPNTSTADDDVMGNYAIRIKQSAGVTNPASAGEKTVKWVENAPNTAEAANKEAKVDINRVISLSKKDGTRGTASTATFKGFANGTATVNLNGSKLAEVTIADNVGTLELDTSSARFEANRDGGNVITAVDSAGNPQAGDGAVFTIKPKLVLDPTATVVSKSVTLKLSDWPDVTIDAVQIGSTTDIELPTPAPETGNDGKVNFSVTLPTTVNRGSQTVKVTGGDASATATLSVGVLELTVEPAMAVPGQEITIQGSGFEDGDDLTSLTIGGKTVAIPSNNEEASSNGDIVITVRVPSPVGSGIGDGSKKVVVTASGSGRVAEGSVNVPEAEISLSPTESRRGTTVTVTGTGFPSGDLVQVKYDNDGTFVTVTAKAADSAGNVEVDFVVPSYADIGSEHDVRAESVGVYDPVSDDATHTTPGAVVTLDPTRVPNGSTITIHGQNFPAFATVAEMTVGGVDVRPVPAPATTIDGDFSATVLVPQMELGNQSVSVRVAQTTFTTFVEIVPATVSRAPQDIFADLVSAGVLDRVYLYENPSTEYPDGNWRLYDPDIDPSSLEEIQRLESLVPGDIIWINVTAAAEFEGINLFVGWNLITIP